jgi:hypothetical protein
MLFGEMAHRAIHLLVARQRAFDPGNVGLNRVEVMASIGGIPLNSPDGTATAGAAFLLHQTPERARSDSLRDASFELQPSRHYMVVRFPKTESPADAFMQGIELAQEALDRLSVLGRGDLSLKAPDSEYIVWWIDGGKTTLRLHDIATTKMEVGPVEFKVHDKDGNEISPQRVTPDYHLALRYYRLSQITEDLYESYRNMYLAFEMLLSSRFPKGKEREIDWLSDSPSTASVDLSLQDLVPGKSDPVTDILNTIYKNARLPLFHAKDGRTFFLPQASSGERQVVSMALSILTKLVLRMAEKWLNSRRSGGWVNEEILHKSFQNSFQNAEMVWSIDRTPFQSDEDTLSHPRFQNATRMSVRFAPELSVNNEPVLFGSADNQLDTGFNPVRRVDVIDLHRPLLSILLDEILDLQGIQRFEVVIPHRVIQGSQPRALFIR